MGGFVDSCEATTSYLFLLLEAVSDLLGFPRPTRGLRLLIGGSHGERLDAAKAARSLVVQSMLSVGSSYREMRAAPTAVYMGTVCDARSCVMLRAKCLTRSSMIGCRQNGGVFAEAHALGRDMAGSASGLSCGRLLVVGLYKQAQKGQLRLPGVRQDQMWLDIDGRRLLGSRVCRTKLSGWW